MTPNHPHIIAAKLPSGAISQGDCSTPESSAAGCGGEETRRPFDTRRSIEAKLDTRPDLYRSLENEMEGADEIVAQWRVTLIDAIVMVLVAVFIGVLLGTGGGF